MKDITEINYLNKLKEKINLLLQNKTIETSEKISYMMTISRFIMLKDLVAVKNPNTKKIEFDSTKYSHLIDPLLDLYDYLTEENNINIPDNLEEKYTIKGTNYPNLIESLWLINSIRNAFAHGKFKYNQSDNTITIMNYDAEAQNKLTCKLPLSLLRDISIKDRKQSVHYELFTEISKKLKMHELDNLLLDIIFCESTFTEEENKLIEQNKLDYLSKDNSLTKETLNPRKIKQELQSLSMDQLQHIIPALTYIYKDISELNTILNYMHKEFVDENINTEKRHSKIEVELEFTDILLEDEISYYNDGIIYLYTYLVMFFSKEKPIDYKYLILKDTHIDQSNQYNEIVNSINKRCNKFNNYIEGQIKAYEHSSEENQIKTIKHSLQSELSSFTEEILNKFSYKNEYIMKSLRNSVEHGNYRFDKTKKEVVLTDKRQEKDKVSFQCHIDPNKLLDLISSSTSVERNSYHIRTFIDELKPIIGEENYLKTVNNFNIIFNILYEKDIDLNKNIDSINTPITKSSQESHKIKLLKLDNN